MRRERQRLGEAARLVELDVDSVVAVGERGKAGAVVHGFVRAYGHSASAGQRGIGAGGQRLLRRPRLVGIRDQARVGAGGADLRQTRGIAGAAELQFQERHRACRGCGLGGHGLGRAEADGVGGDERLR